MALGDYSGHVSCTGALSISVTWVCTECSAGNVTAMLNTPVAIGTAPTIYAVDVCRSCGKTVLIYATTPAISIRAQQVS